MKHTHTAKLVALGIADVAERFETRPLDEVSLTLEGIENDRHAGFTLVTGARQRHVPRGTVIRNSRQLSILSVEELALIGPRADWKKLGGNLLLSGVAGLTQLPPSTRLVFPSGAVVTIDSGNDPCMKSGREVGMTDFVKAAWGKRGLVGWVERSGVLRIGDDVNIWTEAWKT